VEVEGRVEVGMNGEGVRWGLVEEGIGGGGPPC
jgi:hypothetical protein